MSVRLIMCLCICTYLTVYACLFITQSVYLYFHLSIYICLSIHQPVYSSICISVSIYLICVCVRPSVHSSMNHWRPKSELCVVWWRTHQYEMLFASRQLQTWRRCETLNLFSSDLTYSVKVLSVLARCRMRIWCDFDRASSLICGNKMPTGCNRGFYCRSYCLLNVFRAPLCPSSGAQEYYTVVAACGISCCGFQVAGLVWSWGLCVRFAGCAASCKPDT